MSVSDYVPVRDARAGTAILALALALGGLLVSMGMWLLYRLLLLLRWVLL